MDRETVSWKSDGLLIQGEIYDPDDRPQPWPAVAICHGIPAKTKSLQDPGYPQLARRFCREGFTVLIFNFRGTGASEGNFDIRGWARDLEEGLNYLSSRPGKKPHRIFLMGFSAGGAVSIFVAAHRTDIAGVISCASPAHFPDLDQRGKLEDFLAHAREVGIIKDPRFPQLPEDWSKGFQVVRPLDWVERIPPRPLIIIHGMADEVVEVEHARRLYSRVPSWAELFLIPGAGHRLRLEEQAMDKALEWLKNRG